MSMKHTQLFRPVQNAKKYTGWPTSVSTESLNNIGYGSFHDKLDAYLAAWIASLKTSEREALGKPPDDVIWLPLLKKIKKIV